MPNRDSFHYSLTHHPSGIEVTWLAGGYLDKKLYIGYTVEEIHEDMRGFTPVEDFRPLHWASRFGTLNPAG